MTGKLTGYLTGKSVELVDLEEAEEAYHVARGNPREVQRTYELLVDTRLPVGGVEGGEGYQAYIPPGVNPGDILKWIGTRVLD